MDGEREATPTGRPRRHRIVPLVSSLGACFALVSCADVPLSPEQDCCNAADDDSGGEIDATDLDCAAHPLACQRDDPDDRAALVVGGGEQPEAMHEVSRFRAAFRAAFRSEDVRPVEPDVPTVCRFDEDCTLALDLSNCCGGRPHQIAWHTEVCPTAHLRREVESSPCLATWFPGDPVPPIPAECPADCFRIACDPCLEVDRVVCREGACVPWYAASQCEDDSDCPDDHYCTDVGFDGITECVQIVHRCESSEQCRSYNPTCASCECRDVDGDRVRDCACEGCVDDPCEVDLDCEINEFCLHGVCYYGGVEACRVGSADLDCPPCHACQASDMDATRGTCVPSDEICE